MHSGRWTRPALAMITAGLVATMGGGSPLAQSKGSSNLVDATQPARILAVAKGFGSAELETDKQGDPRIRGRIEGQNYFVNFYGCKEGKNCKTLQFRTWFTMAKKPSPEDANAYNQKFRFLKVYVDADQDMVVEFDVNLDGGVSARNLDDTFDWWKLTMKQVIRDFPEK